ncbi:increased DNA methylation 1-like [Rutidosis leptorrhynchoides]|uniref:increased DNA methylation 1-like n=1 Tax=Rutidosis leptorrhynchoides TaxID=125765 RepID=UPI003A9A29C6
MVIDLLFLDRFIYSKLQKIVGVRMQIQDGFSWTLLKPFNLQKDLETKRHVMIECNAKLGIAFEVMDECFQPVYHDRRNKRNMIKDIICNCDVSKAPLSSMSLILKSLKGMGRPWLYIFVTISFVKLSIRSNYKRLNFSGFYTVILEREDEIVAAATIRVHGNKLAEMPFFGTRNLYRGQGMARRLLNSVESILFTVGVKELVVVAIPDVVKMWKVGFGFKPLEASMRRDIKPMGLVMFEGKPILQKRIPPTTNKDLSVR